MGTLSPPLPCKTVWISKRSPLCLATTTRASPSAPTPTPPGRCRIRRQRPWAASWLRSCNSSPAALKTPDRKAKLPVRCSLNLSSRFAVWVKLWGVPPDPLFRPHYFAGKQNKNSRNLTISGVFWSCYPDLNWRPHPYQLIANPRSTAFRCFGGIFVPRNRRQRCFPLHCLRPLVSYCGSSCGSGTTHWPAGDRIRSPPRGTQNRIPAKSLGKMIWTVYHSVPQNTSGPHPEFASHKTIRGIPSERKSPEYGTLQYLS